MIWLNNILALQFTFILVAEGETTTIHLSYKDNPIKLDMSAK